MGNDNAWIFRMRHFNMILYVLKVWALVIPALCLFQYSRRYSAKYLAPDFFYFDWLTGIMISIPVALMMIGIIAYFFGTYELTFEPGQLVLRLLHGPSKTFKSIQFDEIGRAVHRGPLVHIYGKDGRKLSISGPVDIFFNDPLYKEAHSKLKIPRINNDLRFLLLALASKCRRQDWVGESIEERQVFEMLRGLK